MSTVTPQVAEHLQQFRKGDREKAFFGLLEMDHRILPELMAAFPSERDSQVRAFLVEVIWQHRQPSAVSFLGEAVHDSAPEVWKQAIDGLVTLASPAALAVLRAAKTKRPNSDGFHHWIDEAIDQAESEIRR
jgi:hypothetical protein